MPFISFRDCPDPDEKRKEILWTAISFVIILASWLAVVLVFGYRPLAMGMSYDEAVLVIGLGLLLFCSILYLIGKEREQRYTNRRLLGELQKTVGKLDNRVQHLDSLCAVSAELAGSLDVNEISKLVVDALVDCLQAERSYLMLVDSQTGRPVYARRSGEGTVEMPADGIGETAGSFGPTAPPTDQVWPGPLRLVGHGAMDVPAQVREWNALPHLVCAYFACKNGLICIVAARRSKEGRPFAPDDLNMLKTVSNMAAKSLESAHLHAELRENYLATVRSLVLSLDARDNYAASHGQRVTTLAVRVAEYMGLPESAARDIEVFAPLHDVGKIGVRDGILLKNGALTEQEKEVCRQHCLIGDRIIRPLKPGRDALAVIRNHHESWDGRGYPDGLVGEATPLLARIVKVADCYDALISERPYGAVLSEEEALAHFRLHAGDLYDPAVVDALLAVLREEAPYDGAPASRPMAQSNAARAATTGATPGNR